MTLTLASLSEGKNKFRRDETESEPSNSDFADDRELENLTEHEIGNGSHVMTNIPPVRNLALTSAGTRELEKGRDIKMELWKRPCAQNVSQEWRTAVYFVSEICTIRKQ